MRRFTLTKIENTCTKTSLLDLSASRVARVLFHLIKWGSQTMRWDEILNSLSQIPADDPQWTAIDRFIIDLNELAKLKVAERKSQIAFVELARELRTDLCDLLQFLDPAAASKLFSLLDSNSLRLLDALTNLRDALRKYERDREFKSFPSIKAEQSHREKLTNQESFLLQQLALLSLEDLTLPSDVTVVFGGPELQAPDVSVSVSEPEIAESIPSGLSNTQEKAVPLTQDPKETEPEPAISKSTIGEETTKATKTSPHQTPSQARSKRKDRRKRKSMSLPDANPHQGRNIRHVLTHFLRTESPSSPKIPLSIELLKEIVESSDSNDSELSAPLSDDGDSLVTDTSIDLNEAQKTRSNPSESIIDDPTACNFGSAKESSCSDRVSESGYERELDSEYLINAIASYDFAGAYWWSLSSEEKGLTTPVQSSVLALVQGVLWNPRLDLAVADDIQELFLNRDNEYTPAAELLASGAALRVALTVPTIDVNRLLKCTSSYPNYCSLLKLVQGFAVKGLVIDPDIVQEQMSAEKLDEEIAKAANNAVRWIDEAINRRFDFAPAGRVWRHFLKSNNHLRGFFTSISEGKESEAETLRSGLEVWQHRHTILERIRAADEQTNSKFVTKIDASAQEKLVSGCFEAAEVCVAWCNAVNAKRRHLAPQDWMGTQIGELSRELRKLLPLAIKELDEQYQHNQGLMSVAIKFAMECCQSLYSTLLPQDGSTQASTAYSDSLVLSSLEPRGLWPALARRLWSVPGIEIADNGAPFPHEISKIKDALDNKEKLEASLEACFRERVKRRDFRHTTEMLLLMQCNPAVNGLQDLLTEEMRQADEELADKVELVQRKLQDSILNGSIVERDRIRIENELKSINDAKHKAYRIPFEQVNSLEDQLRDLNLQHLRALQSTWETSRQELLSRLTPSESEKITKSVKDAIDSGEPRVVQELLSQLLVAASRQEPPVLKRADSFSNVLADFKDSLPTMVEIAEHWSIDLLEPQKPGDELALESWCDLRRQNIVKDDQRILDVLSLIGLSYFDHGDRVEVVQAKKGEWVHVIVNASDAEHSTIPQFGSLREGCYDILLVSAIRAASPGNTIPAALINAGLQRKPTIVLYQGVIRGEQRMNMARKLRFDAMPAVVLDEALLMWLLQRSEYRWQTFLKVALAFSFVSPYGPTGSVPKEMFFGRQQMLDSILNFDGGGSSIVYGGRQLGKTALLHRAFREFHIPARKQYAIYESIQNLGDPISDVPADEIGRVLGDRLTETILKGTELRSPGLARVTKLVRDYMEANPEARLLILLDEADDFLAQDAKQGFKLVIELKKLMEQTKRHVKVVFAGLNSVQRYQRYPNQPFAHLGSPIEVGPLEPASAYDLVTRPMRDIGFVFEDDAAILKLMSYTNYHPGLIQFFCDSLVKGLQNGVVDDWPPRVITNRAVKDTYARTSTKQEIAKRFSWTLDLNPLFSAIVCKVVIDRFDARTTESVSYRVEELLDGMREWWPAAFEPMAVEEMRVLLTDMCGLGIFFQGDDGYQLRNPNLADAVGTFEEIYSRLDALRDAPAPQSGIDVEHHRLLVTKTNRRSPFTLAQTAQLLAPRYGIGLILGSEALGAHDIEYAVQELLRQKREQGLEVEFQRHTVDVVKDDQWKQQLEEMHQKAGRNPKVVVLVDVAAPASIPDLIRQSLDFCQNRRRAEQSWFRILVRMLPEAVASWQLEPPETRLALEQCVDCLIELALWSPTVVETHFTKGDRLGGTPVFEALADATGGWPCLIEDVYHKCGEGHDPTPHAKAVSQQLESGGELALQFAKSCGVTDIVTTETLRTVLCDYASEPTDLEFLELAIAESFDPPKPEYGTAILRALMRLQIIQRSKEGVRINPQVMKVMGKQHAS